MEKKEIIEKLKQECHDFLNATNPDKTHRIFSGKKNITIKEFFENDVTIEGLDDINLKGFYIEVEDVADILYPLLKDAK